MATYFNLKDSDVRDGYNDLETLINGYIRATSDDNVQVILESAAKEFVDDLKTLTKPYRRIGTASGYKHMIDSFAYEKKKGQMLVGWGKYYGRMVEHGTRKMYSQPHFRPTYERNKDKYYKMMVDKFHSLT